MQEAQDLLREYARLNAKRKGKGISPLEYQRWLDLRMRLEAAFPSGPPLNAGGKTRIRLEFANTAELAGAVMMNVRPIGLFISTPFAAERGTKLELRVHLKETAEVLKSPVVVVSNNVGPDFSTAKLGMGVRFAAPRCALRARLEELCGVQETDGSESRQQPRLDESG